MRKLGGFIYRAVLLLLALFLLLINVRLYVPAASDYGPARIGPDVLAQLRFIKSALVSGAGSDMQDFFPEGYYFSHVLYGLAWVEVGQREAQDSALHQQALAESAWALGEIDSPAGRAPFWSGLNPPYGVFYNGWTNWLRGGVLLLQPAESRDPAMLAQFEQETAALAAAFDASATPFLQAYPGGSWPVDSVVAMAALRLHDSILPPRFDATITRWLAAARDRLDPTTGLLPHRADPSTGEPLDTARGSSQSIIARFLYEVDPAWGAEQYAQFRRQFATTVAGAVGVREYPPGIDAEGDVDSGPLIAGISLSASAVTLGAALARDDRALADPLLHQSEALGMPLEWGGEKRYAFGVLPVGDAFLAWAKTARPWIATNAATELPEIQPAWWRIPIHLFSLLIVVIPASPLLRRLRRA